VAGGPAVTRAVAATATDTDHTVGRWFILAALLVVLGVALVLIGRLRTGRGPGPGLRSRRRSVEGPSASMS
jgi:hypothetical protein